MSEFPPVGAAKEDNGFYSLKRIDKTVRVETEGGYVVTRPRTTRPARRVWTTGWTETDNTTKNLIETFYVNKAGGANSFTWRDPTTNTEYTVRFVGDLEMNYKGIGATHRWSIKVTLEQV